MATTRKANGILPVSATQTTNDAPKVPKSKASAQGKKLVIRRLPPGLTEEEFWFKLGGEWKEKNGRVDWTQWCAGTVTQDPSKSSYPARCYLHVLRTEDIQALNEVVQEINWEDNNKTFTDPVLIGPPYLEQAPYQKVPTTKKRVDPRQGTIDQDPEFMAFLRSLTEETPAKETDTEQTSDDGGKTEPKITTTPLIEFLKEKKANKAKETANAKSAKHARHESQGKPKEDTKKKGKESKSDKLPEKEREKAKEPVKLLTKKAAAQEAAEAAKSAANQLAAGKTTEEAAPKSRRANIAAAAKILQRDLGLSPGSAHRRARQDAAKAEAAAKSDNGKDKETKDPATNKPAAPASTPSSVPPSTPTAPKAQLAEGSRRNRGGKGNKQNASGDVIKGKGTETPNNGNTTKPAPSATPVILKRKEEPNPTASASTVTDTSSSIPAPPTGPKAASNKTTSGTKSSQKKGPNQPSVTSGVTRGFVKHANPSQGVTESLLKQAMEAFGAVTFVEIDKRKGFAYVDFGEHDGLVKAVAASPITVAQGTVQVLERKETKATAEGQPDRPKRGGRGRGRRGAANAANGNGASETSDKTGSAAAP
ncbi:Smg-4/UPF3 family-domain-containing protein [Xylariaceae sp. FL0016]|nr:Smg-4/UPF3 family-domain-containing protein [Xylariaceae sp. FL0016]